MATDPHAPPPPPWTRATWLGLAAALLLAAAARAAAWFPILPSDSVQYLDLARDMVRGDFWRPGFDLDGGIFISRRLIPLYPLFIAGWHKLGVPLLASGYLVNYAAQAGTVALSFGLGRRLAGTRGALLCAAAAALSPWHLAFTHQVLTESLFAFWTTAALAAGVLAAEKPGWRSGALVGAAAAGAYLTREIGLALIGMAGASAVLFAAFGPREERGARLRTVAGMAAAFFLLGLPFWVLVRLRLGHFALSLRSGVVDALVMREAGAARISWLDQRPGLALAYLLRTFTPKTLAEGVALAGAGWLLVAGGRARPLAVLAVAWAAGLAVAVGMLGPTIILDRYVYSPLVFLELAGAVGMACLSLRLGRLPWGRRARGAAAAAPAVALLAAFAISGGHVVERQWTVRRHHDYPIHYSLGIAEAAREVAARCPLPARPRVMDRKGFSAFFLDAPLTVLPETREELDRALRERPPDLIFIDSFMVRDLRPRLAYLIAGRDIPAGMKVVYQRFDPRLKKIFTVYARDGLGCRLEFSGGLPEMRRAFRRGDFLAARALGQAVLQQDPQNLDARVLLAKMEFMTAAADGLSLPRMADEVRAMIALAPGDPRTREMRQGYGILASFLAQSRSPADIMDLSFDLSAE